MMLSVSVFSIYLRNRTRKLLSGVLNVGACTSSYVNTMLERYARLVCDARRSLTLSEEAWRVLLWSWVRYEDPDKRERALLDGRPKDLLPSASDAAELLNVDVKTACTVVDKLSDRLRAMPTASRIGLAHYLDRLERRVGRHACEDVEISRILKEFGLPVQDAPVDQKPGAVSS